MKGLKTKTINPANWGVSKDNKVTYKYKQEGSGLYIEVYNYEFYVIKIDTSDGPTYSIKESSSIAPVGVLYQDSKGNWVAYENLSNGGGISREGKTRDEAVVRLLSNLY